MKTIKCRLCKKETTIINNKCQNCCCSIFICSDLNDIENNENYNLIIEDISNKTQIEKEIIQEMFKLRLFSNFVKKIEICSGFSCVTSYVPSIEFTINDHQLIFFIDNFINKKTNYSKSYLYFKYNLSNVNTYLNKYKQIYMHFKNNEKIILSLIEDTLSNEILVINIKFNLQDYCVHPIEWLNREEKINLEKNINNIFNIYSINDKEYVRYIINLDLNKENIEDLFTDIDNKISEFINLNELEKEKMKEGNLKYFERTLLELELKYF